MYGEDVIRTFPSQFSMLFNVLEHDGTPYDLSAVADIVWLGGGVEKHLHPKSPDDQQEGALWIDEGECAVRVELSEEETGKWINQRIQHYLIIKSQELGERVAYQGLLEVMPLLTTITDLAEISNLEGTPKRAHQQPRKDITALIQKRRIQQC